MPLFEPSIMTISAGTTWATGPGVSFANSNGISFGVTGNTITASVAVTMTVTQQPITVFSQHGGFETHYTLSNAQISFQKVSLPMAISGSSGVVLADLAGHSDSSGAFTISIGAYAISGLTAGTITTQTAGYSWTSGSDTSASSEYGGVSGTRYRSFPWPVSMNPGDYLFAFAVSTSNDGSLRIFGRQGVNIVGSYAGADTAYFLDGVSLATSAAFPISVAAIDPNYARTGLSAAQQPGFILIGTT